MWEDDFVISYKGAPLGTYSHLYTTIDREVADNLKNTINIKTSTKSLIN